jgi:hypothetical protein
MLIDVRGGEFGRLTPKLVKGSQVDTFDTLYEHLEGLSDIQKALVLVASNGTAKIIHQLISDGKLEQAEGVCNFLNEFAYEIKEVIDQMRFLREENGG